MVDIGGFDCTACSGLHLERTGQAGLVHWSGEERIRGHHRLHWKIGERALLDYRQKERVIGLLSRELSSGLEELPPAVARLKGQLRESGLALSRLEERLAGSLAAELSARGRTASGRCRVLERCAAKARGWSAGCSSGCWSGRGPRPACCSRRTGGCSGGWGSRPGRACP